MLRFEMAHIKAYCKGGSNDLKNILPLCSECNKELGSKELDITKYEKGLSIILDTNKKIEL